MKPSIVQWLTIALLAGANTAVRAQQDSYGKPAGNQQFQTKRSWGRMAAANSESGTAGAGRATVRSHARATWQQTVKFSDRVFPAPIGKGRSGTKSSVLEQHIPVGFSILANRTKFWRLGRFHGSECRNEPHPGRRRASRTRPFRG